MSITMTAGTKATPSQAGYTATRSVSGNDLGCGALNSPTDLFRDADDNFYIVDSGNNRIVMTDSAFTEAIGVFDTFYYEDGTETILSDPEGIYVSDETGLMYIADTGNSRCLVCDADGTVQMELTRPDSTLYENETFRPQKIVVDKAGNIYMVSQQHHKWCRDVQQQRRISGLFRRKLCGCDRRSRGELFLESDRD